MNIDTAVQMGSTPATSRDVGSPLLRDEEIQSYKETGFLVLERAFTRSEVIQMRREADRVLELLINSSVAHRRMSRRLNMCLSGPDQAQHVRRVQPVNDLSLLITRCSMDDRVSLPVRQLLGEESALMEEKIVYKQRLPKPVSGIDCQSHDDRFVVHSDYEYFRDQGYSPNLLTAAICLDDCTTQSGPLTVFPGTHTADFQHERTMYGRQAVETAYNRHSGIDLLAPAGSILFFHAKVLHSSSSNTTPRPRRLLLMSHVGGVAQEDADRRNGPIRRSESPFEWDYVRMKSRGEYTDIFQAPPSYD